MSDNRFDIRFDSGGPRPDYHFCREWDADGGCYGTNPDHGFSWDEAKAEVIRWHKEQIEYWAGLTEEAWSGVEPSDTSSVAPE